jgi:thioredoxin reductase/bacterioferritin-associated ferredoxin
MFRRLTEASRPALTIVIDGACVQARPGDSVAAAMLATGHLISRRAGASGAPRAPFCLMGACFECCVTVDGVGNRQGCMVEVREGMRIETGQGKPEFGADPPAILTAATPQVGSYPTCGTYGADLGQARAPMQVGSYPTCGTYGADLGQTRAPMRERYDIAVVGAGPAGLAAASLCARAGLDTALFDEQAHPGGQIYRAVTASPLRPDTVLGEDYWQGGSLVRQALDSGAHYVPGANVWGLLRPGELAASVAGRSCLIEAKRVILATGAIERPFPIPGWTLPGVMTAGGAQILLKSSGLVPQGRAVLAGCGPLLWLLAWQYLNAGVRIEAILDTAARASFARALRHAAGFAASPYLAKGLRLMLAVRRELRAIGNVVALEAQGNARLERVAYRTSGGRQRSLPADALLLHQGVVPSVNLAMSAGVAHRWSDTQLCFVPVLDEYGSTNVPGLAIAGDGAGIAGVEAAEARGALAAIAAIRSLGGELALAAEEKAARASLRRFERGRAFLDLAFQPRPQFRRPRGETLVCRCEEVRARQIIDTVAIGAPGPNQMKAFLRCGMGPCQGRLCGLTVTELMAEARGVAPDEIGYYRLRPPVKPVTLAELAGLPTSDAAVRAVVRD